MDASKPAHEAEEKRKSEVRRQLFLSRIFAVAAVIALLVVVGIFGWNLHQANTGEIFNIQ